MKNYESLSHTRYDCREETPPHADWKSQCLFLSQEERSLTANSQSTCSGSATLCVQEYCCSRCPTR